MEINQITFFDEQETTQEANVSSQINFPVDWAKQMNKYISSNNFSELIKRVEAEYDLKQIYPSRENLFNAFRLTPYSDTKLVIIGQDPYHGPNQAHGLSFSVQKNCPVLPPSLVNIFKEISADIGIPIPKSGDLTPIAKQGVLLLNASLTVEKSKPNSHANIGWSSLITEVIKSLNVHPTPVVYLLWGKFAQGFSNLITNPKHLILKCAHPSPFSASYGFFGCKHFSKANSFLRANNLLPIDYSVLK